MVKVGNFFHFLLLGVLVFHCQTQAQQKKPTSTSLFWAINCQVLDVDGKPMPVAAYRNSRCKDEIILISRTADHALLVNLKEQKAFKISKPIWGTNAVTVSDERPITSGNVGFMVRNHPQKKNLTEIIVHFKEGSCFLCGPQTFAAVWE
jgi:hypothetical protein